jgi:hypothetical protein
MEAEEVMVEMRVDLTTEVTSVNITPEAASVEVSAEEEDMAVLLQWVVLWAVVMEEVTSAEVDSVVEASVEVEDLLQLASLSREASAREAAVADSPTEMVRIISQTILSFLNLIFLQDFGGGGGGGGFDPFAYPTAQRKTGTCYAFQRGECDRGDSCRFAHGPGGGGGGGGFGGGGFGGGRPTGICYAFQRGECERGDSCRYSHDPNADPGVGYMPSSGPKICFAYQKGECMRGDACRYSHMIDGY